MAEKYKVYLSSITKKRLEIDAEQFEFYKKDGTVNLNAFVKTLIVNYFEEFQSSNRILRNKIKEIIETKTHIEDGYIEDIIDSILEVKTINNQDAAGNDVGITITVSGESQNTIDLITENLLRNIGLSEYIRNMIISYLDMPRNEREKRIFKNEYEQIRNAIKKHKRISFLSKKDKKKFIVDPYSLSTSKQEQNNYLLCFDRTSDKERSFRMSRISSIYILDEESNITEESIKKFKIAEKKGPQFTFSDVQEACVLLSDEGKRKFKMVYTNRPEVSRVEGDYYYFEWPLIQLEEYFKRFGKDAVIISPVKSHEIMNKFYKDAAKEYNHRTNV